MNFKRRNSITEKSRYCFGLAVSSFGILFLMACSSIHQTHTGRSEVMPSELRMVDFTADSSATAVILIDLGDVSFNDQLEMIFERYRRVKILRKAGQLFGTVTIPFYAEDDIQKITDITGQTYRLSPGGLILSAKLEKDSIATEDLHDGWKQVNFTLPLLQPGSVFEYRYKVRSKSVHMMPDWNFQNSEPTLWSEFRAEIPELLEYTMVKPAIDTFNVHDAEVHAREFPYFTIFGIPVRTTAFVKHRWAMRHVPALREEPFITALDDYRMMIRLQLSKILDHDRTSKWSLKTWNALFKELMEQKNFGKQLGGNASIRSAAQSLAGGIESPAEKMQAIYDHIRTTIKWDSTLGIFTKIDLDAAYAKRRGGGPEIALMLTTMLRSAGLKATPVLISTRWHGQIIKQFPLLKQFNHVLTYVNIDGKEYLLDPTDPLRPYNLIPEFVLNQVGWLVQGDSSTASPSAKLSTSTLPGLLGEARVSKDDPKWIQITNPAKYARQTTVSAAVSDSGIVSGEFETFDRDYSALHRRHLLKKKTERDFLHDEWFAAFKDTLADTLKGARLDSFLISCKDSIEKPLLTRVAFSISKQAKARNGYIYFNPMFFGGIGGHYLNQKKRRLPVDLGCGQDYLYTLNLKLPPGYYVYEQPVNIVVRLPNKGGELYRMIEAKGDTLKLTSRILLNRSRFAAEEYKRLSEFYDRIVGTHDDYIVLRRRTPISKSEKPEPVVWGDVPQEDLKMKELAFDSVAAAYVLADIGAVSFDQEFRMVQTFHKRIKIFSEEGKSWGNVNIRFFAGKGVQKIANIRGQVFNLANDGAVTRDTLALSTIHSADVGDGWRTISFTLPSVSPGAVLEYRYEIHSQSPDHFHGWSFQNGLPTRLSEFHAQNPDWLHFREVTCQDGLALDVSLPTPTAKPSGFMIAQRWTLQNVPALRPGPFMTNLEDYRSRIHYQLDRVYRHNEGWIKKLPTWRELTNKLMLADRFGRQLDRHHVLRQRALLLVKGRDNDDDKMRAVYEHVRASMEWNGQTGIFTAVDLDEAYKSKSAGVPEINLILTAMLRYAGLEAHPMLISTRAHGMALQTVPQLDQFNYVLAYVKTKEKEFLLDATDPLRPHDLLPFQTLNGSGWVVDRANPRWVEIQNLGSSSKQIFLLAALSTNGKIGGSLQTVDRGYSAVQERHHLLNMGKNNYIKNWWFGQFNNANIDSFSITNQDSIEQSFATKTRFSITDTTIAQIKGDSIVFSPILFGQNRENPFKERWRVSPVDFGHGRRLSYTLNLTLPESYVVQELPLNIELNLPNNGGKFRWLAEIQGNTLQFLTELDIRKHRFELGEYSGLWEFYDRLVTAQAQPIILRRR